MVLNSKHSVIAIALITAVCLAGDSMLYVALPTHWKEVGLSSIVQVGVLLSVNRFVRLPLNPLIGFMYKKMKFRNGILLAVMLSGITTICYGLVHNFTIWVILRSVWGFAWSFFKLGAYLLILQLSTDLNRGNLMGTYNGLYRLGSLLGMLLGGFFADIFGLKVISFVLGISAFIIIPSIFKYIPKTIQAEERFVIKPSFKSSVKSFLNSEFIMLIVTAFLLTMLLDGMLTATLSHIIEVKFTNKINMLGVVIGAATLAGVVQAMRWGITPFVVPKIGNMLDRANQKNMILAIFLSFAFILLVIIPLNVSLLFWLPILLIYLLVASVLTTILDALVGDQASKVPNKIFIMTFFTIIIDLGAALGPITGYILEQKMGLTNLFWLTAAICFLLTIKWLFPSKEWDDKKVYHRI